MEQTVTGRPTSTYDNVLTIGGVGTYTCEVSNALGSSGQRAINVSGELYAIMLLYMYLKCLHVIVILLNSSLVLCMQVVVCVRNVLKPTIMCFSLTVVLRCVPYCRSFYAWTLINN